MKRSKKERFKDIADRRDVIVGNATKESLDLLNSQPRNHRIANENYRIIHDTCLQLLTPESGKITCPNAENVVSFLAKHQPGSPVRSARTVINRYRDMVHIWTTAYDAIVRLNIYNDSGWTDLKSSASAPIAGDFTELQIKDEQIRRLNITINGLRALILRARPEGSAATALEPPVAKRQELLDLTSFRKWVSQIGKKGSLLEATEAGIKLTDRARINAIIMDRLTFDELKKLL